MEPLATRSQMLPLLDTRELELILFPTEQCNFRCTYCYEDFSIGRMKPDIVAGVKRLIERRSEDMARFRLSWFGGEPLVARDLVFDISEHASRLARSTPFAYMSHMTTNGYLLDATTCDRLVAAGVNDFQISLDGWGASHDVSRRRADHKGTFGRIWKNLLSMRNSSHDFHVLLRVHLQPHNLDGVKELTSHMIREFGDDRRFDVFFKGIGNWGGPNSAQIKTLSRQEAIRVRAELEASWSALRAQAASRELELEPKPQTQTPVQVQAQPPAQAQVQPQPAPEQPLIACYAARPNSLTIRADGRIGKCTVMLTDARNDIGMLRPDGTIAMTPGRLAPWLRGFQSANRVELGCPAQNLPKLPEAAPRVGELLPLM